MLTGLAVVGVARFLQQRQDYENATARSYQLEIAARNRLAAGTHPAAARATIVAQQHKRQTCATTSTARPATRRCWSARA